MFEIVFFVDKITIKYHIQQMKTKTQIKTIDKQSVTQHRPRHLMNILSSATSLIRTFFKHLVYSFVCLFILPDRIYHHQQQNSEEILAKKKLA